MDTSFILSNARLANGGEPGAAVEIAVADGRIAAIGTKVSGPGERIDVGGHLVSPGLLESHFHLDKSRILDHVELLNGVMHMRRVQFR